VNIDAAGEIQCVDGGATCNKIVAQVVESLVLDSEVIILAEGERKACTIGEIGAVFIAAATGFTGAVFTGTHAFQLMIRDFKAGALVHLIADVERVFNGLISMQRQR
jgi:hypothetical protein